MAKRRTFGRRSRSYSRGGGVGMGDVIGGAVYGAVGERLLGSVTTMVPANQDLVKGAACWLIAKRTSGVIRDTARAGLAIAAYNGGKTMLSGGLGTIFGTAASSGNTVSASF